MEDYLPFADEWVLWDNAQPPHVEVADSSTHSIDELKTMLSSSKFQETPHREKPEFVRIGLEASRVATEKMLDYYRRMDIRVTPEMTLAPEPEPKKRARRAGL
jgi:hypothetical protein